MNFKVNYNQPTLVQIPDQLLVGGSFIFIEIAVRSLNINYSFIQHYRHESSLVIQIPPIKDICGMIFKPLVDFLVHVVVTYFNKYNIHQTKEYTLLCQGSLSQFRSISNAHPVLHIVSGDLAIVKDLENQPHLYYEPIDDCGNTILHYAVVARNNSSVDYLLRTLSKTPESLLKMNKDGYSPIDYLKLFIPSYHGEDVKILEYHVHQITCSVLQNLIEEKSAEFIQEIIRLENEKKKLEQEMKTKELRKKSKINKKYSEITGKVKEPSVNRSGRLMYLALMVQREEALLQIAINFDVEIVAQSQSTDTNKIKIDTSYLIQEKIDDKNVKTLHKLKMPLICLPKNSKTPLIGEDKCKKYEYFYHFATKNFYGCDKLTELAKKKYGDKVFRVVMMLCIIYSSFSKTSYFLLDRESLFSEIEIPYNFYSRTEMTKDLEDSITVTKSIEDPADKDVFLLFNLSNERTDQKN